MDIKIIEEAYGVYWDKVKQYNNTETGCLL